MNKEQVARLIDHTLLKPEATPAQVERLCDEARRYGFASVCVNPVYVKLAAEKLAGSGVAVCTVVGFPLGATTTSIKVQEAQQAMADGASEIDMVIHIGALKAGDHDAVQKDIAAVAAACHAGGALLKVIIEAVLLSDEEKVIACQLAGADFVKTSTGFAGGGATVEDVRLMRRAVGPHMGIKAAGGVRSYADAMAMVEAGATRIGASAGVEIVEQAPLEQAPPEQAP
jgi:deoxyribose-phosphate aldolase